MSALISTNSAFSLSYSSHQQQQRYPRVKSKSMAHCLPYRNRYGPARDTSTVGVSGGRVLPGPLLLSMEIKDAPIGCTAILAADGCHCMAAAGYLFGLSAVAGQSAQGTTQIQHDSSGI